MIDEFYSDPITQDRLRRGPLGDHIEGFAAALKEQGYAKATGKEQLRLVTELSLWLGRRHLEVSDFDEERIDQFLRYRRRKRRLVRSAATTLHKLLKHLRQEGVAPIPPPVVDYDDQSRIKREFSEYLIKERGLSQSTVVNYLPVVCQFLSGRFDSDPILFDEIGPQDIAAFVLSQARILSPGRAKLVVTALRCFFRFLLQHGKIKLDLTASVPTVADRRLSTVPKYLELHEVERVLETCNLSSPTGRRNYAILLLLARLGLRAGEVVDLKLDDIDWRTGEIVVRGKGGYRDRLPLLPDIGEALAAYLSLDRPRCHTRHLFICMRAPHRGLSHPSTVSTIVMRALQRAGLQPSNKLWYSINALYASTQPGATYAPGCKSRLTIKLSSFVLAERPGHTWGRTALAGHSARPGMREAVILQPAAHLHEASRWQTGKCRTARTELFANRARCR